MKKKRRWKKKKAMKKENYNDKYKSKNSTRVVNKVSYHLYTSSMKALNQQSCTFKQSTHVHVE